jgi:hypothetical protein
LLCLSYYVYVFSSVKLEIRAEQVLPGSRVRVGRWRRLESGGAGGRNDLNNVRMCKKKDIERAKVQRWY